MANDGQGSNEDADRKRAERKAAKAARRSAKGGQAKARKPGKAKAAGDEAGEADARPARKRGKTAPPAAADASEGDIAARLDRIEAALETQSKRSKEVLLRVNELLGSGAGGSAPEKDG